MKPNNADQIKNQKKKENSNNNTCLSTKCPWHRPGYIFTTGIREGKHTHALEFGTIRNTEARRMLLVKNIKM